MAMQTHHNTASEKFTPPSSVVEAPLTPPLTTTKPSKPVAKILRLLRERKSGRNVLQSPWHELKLQLSEYNELLRLLKNDESLWVFTETKVRYDYDSTTSTLIIRMPTQLHEIFITRVVKVIEGRLSDIANGETESSSFARKIKHNGSGRLILRTVDNNQSIIKREPDAEFKHEDALWPGVIIEVSYSQKTKEIPHLADDYILETNGSIRVVVGLDLDYKTKKATISIWRPQYVTNSEGEIELVAVETDRQIFRDEHGNHCRDVGLKLGLRDFAPQCLAGDLDEFFWIDSVTLCRYLEEAEKVEREAKQNEGLVEHLQQGAKKRRRARTPPEELFSEDEYEFKNKERRVRARLWDTDTPYKSSESE